MHTAFHLYNLFMGLLGIAGLSYLLYIHGREDRYQRFVYVTVTGILIFLVVAPLVEVVSPDLIHLVHGIAALCIAFGLYDPIRNDLRRDQWAALLLEDPAAIREAFPWMVPMDDRILELFHSSKLVLTPSLIAYNIDHSRSEVNRRLTELEQHGLVERVERGKYRLTERGENYLHGDRPSVAPGGDGTIEPGTDHRDDER